MLFTVGVLGQEEAVLYEYEDYDFECPDEYLGYFPHLFRYGRRKSASKSSIRRFVITEKAPIRAFSWLKAATTAFTFKTLC